MGKIYTLKKRRVYENVNCIICTKEFRPASSRQRVCSEKCYKEKTNIEKNAKEQSILSLFDPTLVKSNAKRIIKLMKSTKWKITDERTVDHASSPTGRAFLGVAKSPLQIVTNGYGYKGVLLQTDNREFIQCHVCGKWLRQIQQKHLDKHNIDKDQYRKAYGLMKTTALVSDAMSESLSIRAILRNKVSPNSNKHLNNARATAMSRMANHVKKDNVEYNNRFGLCEQQLGYRLVEFVKKYKDLPSRSTKGEGGMITKALHRRYGSTNDGFKHYGLPVRYKSGTNVELLAQNGKQLFFNYNKKSYSREEIYHWMIRNSSVLQGTVNAFAQKDLPLEVGHAK